MNYKKYLSGVLAAAMVLNTGAVSVLAAGTDTSVQEASQTQTSSTPETVYVNSYDGKERSVSFNDHWRFYLGELNGAEAVSYNDSSWDDVTLPHDYSIDQGFSTAAPAEQESGYVLGGTGWYRKSFTLDESMQGKTVSIDFDGVYMNATVYLNGEKLGTHPYGYTPFSFVLPQDKLKFGSEENVITVKVDHKQPSSRWYSGSGIYRDVKLTVADPVHVANYGTTVTTPDIESGKGTVSVVTEVQNDSSEAADVSVKQTVYEKGSDVPAAEGEKTKVQSVAAGKTARIEASVTVADPKLWDTENPNLYTVKTEVYVGDTLKDSYHSDFGFRWVNFTTEKGFYLNGKNIKLHGVSMHHDQGSLGSEAWERSVERQVQELKQMGVNAIRVTHNPASQVLIDVCNREGIMLVEEAFDCWLSGKAGNTEDYGKWFYQTIESGNQIVNGREGEKWAEFDLKAMVRRGRNNPSIIMWSIGNEIDYPNDPYCHSSFTTMTGNNDADKPAEERQYNPKRPDAGRLAVLAGRLTKIVKEIDTTRPVTLAAAFPELSSRLGFLDSLDVAGYNYKEHLYEESHRRFPDKPFIGSENGHSLEAWEAVTKNPYISGQFLWTGIDYLGEAKGWPIHGSGAGLLTLAGFEKPGYYRRQSLWSSKPMVHLSTARPDADRGEWTPVSDTWNYPEEEEVLVKCYTNLPQAEIWLNEKCLGTFQKDPARDAIILTTAYVPGTLKALGKASDGTEVSHALTTTGTACKISLHCYEDTLPSATEPAFRQIEVHMKDTWGNPVLSDTSLLHVNAENGRILGLENGDLADVTDYCAAFRRVYHGRLLIYVNYIDEEKEMTITVSGDAEANIKTAVLTLPPLK